jgi:hypothetical protein
VAISFLFRGVSFFFDQPALNGNTSRSNIFHSLQKTQHIGSCTFNMSCATRSSTTQPTANFSIVLSYFVTFLIQSFQHLDLSNLPFLLPYVTHIKPFLRSDVLKTKVRGTIDFDVCNVNCAELVYVRLKWNIVSSDFVFPSCFIGSGSCYFLISTEFITLFIE